MTPRAELERWQRLAQTQDALLRRIAANLHRLSMNELYALLKPYAGPVTVPPPIHPLWGTGGGLPRDGSWVGKERTR